MGSTRLPRKDLFHLPEGIIYLDGNSLGPLPRAVMDAATETIVAEWGGELIRAWNTADWMMLPQRVGSRIAGLIGAPAESVATGDTLSIKVFQALAAGLEMRPDRKVILTDTGNFPSDLYIAGGLIDLIDRGYELKKVAPDAVAGAIDPSVAVVMLTQSDYRTGRLHDMAEITGMAHGVGAVMIWDLAHTAGTMALDLAGSNAEFAVGCTYKYLNGGPGAPAFIYVRPDLATSVKPALAGWMGHDAPFAMDLDYRPAMSTERMRVGTPPVVQLAILDRALDVWDGVDLNDIRSATIELSELFIAEIEASCPELILASPRQPGLRGAHASFSFAHGYATIRALIDRGVIGDFRTPDIMRFGFTPLFVDKDDVVRAAGIVKQVLDERSWDDARYEARARVT